jgi:hypothetical protein
MNRSRLFPASTPARSRSASSRRSPAAAYLAGDVHGSHKAELACANQRADANGKAVTEWQEAASNQRHLDASARQADRQATQSALNDAAAVAQKFADMHVAIVKLNPPGECTLSPEWVTAFNGAR